jgi:hypothetical protein
MGLGLTDMNGSVVIVTFGVAPEGIGPAMGVLLVCACTGCGAVSNAKVDRSNNVAIKIVSTNDFIFFIFKRYLLKLLITVILYLITFY